MASGLTATLPRGASPYKLSPHALVIIGYDTPHKKGQHPLWRKVDEPPEWLIDSARQHGIQKKIWVVKEKDSDGKERLVVVDGRTRTLAARKAGLEIVECELKTAEQAHLYGLSFLANLGHHGETPYAIAEAARELVDSGKSEKEVAAYLQVDVPMVKVYLSLDKLIDVWHKSVESGETSVTAASKLVNMTPEQQLAEYEATVGKGLPLTVRTAEAARSKATAAKKGKADGGIAPPQRRVVRKLVERLEAGEVQAPDVTWDFVAGAKWATGMIGTEKVKGLSAAVREATAKPKKEPKAKKGKKS